MQTLPLFYLKSTPDVKSRVYLPAADDMVTLSSS